jgi:hypothetical protein
MSASVITSDFSQMHTFYTSALFFYQRVYSVPCYVPEGNVPTYPGNVSFSLLFSYRPTVGCLRAGLLLKRKGPKLSPRVINPDKEGRSHSDGVRIKLHFHVNSYFAESYIKRFLKPLVAT